MKFKPASEQMRVCIFGKRKFGESKHNSYFIFGYCDYFLSLCRSTDCCTYEGGFESID